MKNKKHISKLIICIIAVVLLAIILAVTLYKTTDIRFDVLKSKKYELPYQKTEITENRKNELVFNITADDFIERYNALYSQKNKSGYLPKLSEWIKTPEETAIHSDYPANYYEITENKKAWGLPTTAVYTPNDGSGILEIVLGFDWHSYTDKNYDRYTNMCYYTLKTVFPKLSDEQIINLYSKVNDSGYRHCYSSEEWYSKDTLPADMYYKDNICVYSYFAIGSCQRLCIIPATENAMEDFKQKGVTVYEIE